MMVKVAMPRREPKTSPQRARICGSRCKRRKNTISTATSRKISASDQSISGLSAQPHPRVRPGVGYIREYQAKDIKDGANKHHAAHNGEILRLDGIQHVAAEPGYTEERLDQQAAHKQ